MKSSKVSILLVCLLMGMVSHGFGQSPKDHWFFGTGGFGIRFDGNEPELDSLNKLESLIGAVSMSDSNGQLLFYSNGHSFFSRNHQLMPNGDGLQSGSTDDVIALPSSSDADVYFVVSVYHGVEIRTINMAANEGWGDVVAHRSLRTEVRDWELFAKGVTAIKSCEGDAYWVVTLRVHNGTEQLAVWNIDAGTGALNDYHVYETGLDIPYFIKEMVTSPDGRQIVLVSLGQVFVIDFNPICGEPTAFHSLNHPKLDIRPRGACYSPNSRNLYLSYTLGFDSGFVYQLPTDSLTSLQALKLSYSGDHLVHGLLNGPDERMYMSTLLVDHQFSTIMRLENPNEQAWRHRYQLNVLRMPRSQYSNLFPNFISDARNCSQAKELPRLKEHHFCEGDSIQLSLKDGYVADSVFLVDTLVHRSVVFDGTLAIMGLDTGRHSYQLHWSNCGRSYSRTQQITLRSRPQVVLNDTTLCKGDSLSVTTKGNVKQEIYLWQDSLWRLLSHSDVLSEAGRYKIVRSKNQCLGVDSFELNYRPAIAIGLADSQRFCPNAGAATWLEAMDGFTSYTWQPSGETENRIHIETAGWHYVQVQDSFSCHGYDSIELVIDCQPHIWIPNAFSPNGDGINDFFAITYSNTRITSLQIFDRWGALVFTSTDGSSRWDGKKNGEELTVGAYTCIVRSKPDFTNEPEQLVFFNLYLLR